MFERFTEGARTVVTDAVGEARALGHDPVGTTHLFLGLLRPGAGAGYQVLHEAGLQADAAREIIRRRTPGAGALTRDDADALRAVGIDLDVVLERLAETFGPDAVPDGHPRRGRTRLSPPAKKALQLALREAIWLKSKSIGSEHLLLGLLRCDDDDLGTVLTELGVPADSLRDATLRAIGRAA
ncbi:Clp protease [Cellulomonas sp. WB94]|uniref:Clp protease N-terminal domain-containing protein n=1 Tax=Cellulomonas sp. WB94 TaxID=2173174 RepID=UPI000D578C30|nr:Clp protease N-terminal domain-containing protein [Cellulomonas sp. WB94]PVU83944.1 Clp protease [Cellulomonas sp. WB94]